MKRSLFISISILLVVVIVICATLFLTTYKNRLIDRFRVSIAEYIDSDIEIDLKINFFKHFPEPTLLTNIVAKNITYTYDDILFLNNGSIGASIEWLYDNKLATFEIVKGKLNIENSEFDINGFLNMSNSNNIAFDFTLATNKEAASFTISNNRNGEISTLSFYGTINVVSNNNTLVITPNINTIAYNNLDIDSCSASVSILPNGWNFNSGKIAFSEGGDIFLDMSAYSTSRNSSQLSITAKGSNINPQEIASLTSIGGNKILLISNSINSPINFEIEISGEIDSIKELEASSITGSGKIDCESVTLPESEDLNSILSFFQMDKNPSTTLTNLNILFTIANEKIVIEPFDTYMGDIALKVSGSQGFDGTLNYNIQAEMEREKIDASINSILNVVSEYASMFGFSVPNANKPLSLSIHIGGTQEKPILSF